MAKATSVKPAASARYQSLTRHREGADLGGAIRIFCCELLGIAKLDVFRHDHARPFGRAAEEPLASGDEPRGVKGAAGNEDPYSWPCSMSGPTVTRSLLPLS